MSSVYHSLTINGINTFRDWHIVATQRPAIKPPTLKQNYLDIPGMDGQLDFTETLSGRPLFGMREGTIDFIVLNGYQPWEILYSSILNSIHGRESNIILDDDPEWYYTGRLSVNEWKSEPVRSIISINYKLDPYKRSIYTSLDDSVLQQYCKNIKVNGKTERDFTGLFESMPVVPIFDVDTDEKGITAIFYNEADNTNTKLVLYKGIHTFDQFIITCNNRNQILKMSFEGKGTVNILFRNGKL